MTDNVTNMFGDVTNISDEVMAVLDFGTNMSSTEVQVYLDQLHTDNILYFLPSAVLLVLASVCGIIGNHGNSFHS